MNETRTFAIDIEDYGPYEVANELWDLMDGVEPRLTEAAL